MAKIQLIKFGGEWCAVCNHMDRARVIEQLAAISPDLNVIKHEMHEDADVEDPIEEAYGIRAAPTLIFEDPTTGQELIRHEGGLSLTDLKKLYGNAQEIAAGDRKLSKNAQKHAPRLGGYEGVRARAEQAEEAPNDAKEE